MSQKPPRSIQNRRQTGLLALSLSVLLFLCVGLYRTSSFSGTRKSPFNRVKNQWTRCDHPEASCCVGMESNKNSPLERISHRAFCRMLTPEPKRLPLRYTPKSEEAGYYVSHDLDCVGRLGNILFAVASTFGIGHRTGRTAVFTEPDSHWFSSFFQNPLPVEQSSPIYAEPTDSSNYECSDESFAMIYNISHIQRYSVQNSSQNHRVVLTGYLQSWKYFDGIASWIKWQFVFTRSAYQAASAAIEKELSQLHFIPETIIGVHVRRGDILRNHSREFGHTAASDEYIRTVVTRLNTTHVRSVFAVVSNDLEYCRELLGMFRNVVYLDGNEPQIDLAVLTLMDHLVITVGTFGWWGAYLSDAGEIYYYKDWPVPNSEMASMFRHEDYFLPHWKAES